MTTTKTASTILVFVLATFATTSIQAENAGLRGTVKENADAATPLSWFERLLFSRGPICPQDCLAQLGSMKTCPNCYTPHICHQINIQRNTNYCKDGCMFDWWGFFMRHPIGCESGCIVKTCAENAPVQEPVTIITQTSSPTLPTRSPTSDPAGDGKISLEVGSRRIKVKWEKNFFDTDSVEICRLDKDECVTRPRNSNEWKDGDVQNGAEKTYTYKVCTVSDTPKCGTRSITTSF